MTGNYGFLTLIEKIAKENAIKSEGCVGEKLNRNGSFFFNIVHPNAIFKFSFHKYGILFSYLRSHAGF